MQTEHCANCYRTFQALHYLRDRCDDWHALNMLKADCACDCHDDCDHTFDTITPYDLTRARCEHCGTIRACRLDTNGNLEVANARGSFDRC